MTEPAPTETTLAARLTAAAAGAIAVVALAGPRAAAALAAALDRPLPVDGVARRRSLLDGAEAIDDALAVAWDDGRRAELHLHGGPRIVEQALDLLARNGASVVPADDFMARTTDADETTAEIDAALRCAMTTRMAQWLLAQRRLLPGFVAAPPASLDGIATRRAVAARRLVDGVRIAIIGPPNAGKSSLANRLIGHDRIITTDTPGTTRDWVDETAVIHGWPVTLTDTAGVRETDDELEALAMRRGARVAHAADLHLVVVDGSRPADDRALARRDVRAALERAAPPSERRSPPRLVVLNKLDLFANAPHRNSAPGFCDELPVSALTGDGVDALRHAILEALDLHLLGDDVPTPFTARQFARLGLPLS